MDALTKTRDAAQDAIFDQNKLPDLAKWSTGGFGALAALLTFFGVKDELLTRILSADPTAALWAMLLIGAGLVLSAFGLAVKGDAVVMVWVLAAAVTVAAGVSAVLLEDLGETRVTTILLIGSLIGLIGFIVLAEIQEWMIPVSAALVVLATACTALGLYSAAKISVTAKAAPEDMRVSAKFTGTQDPLNLEITLAGSKQEAGDVVVAATRTTPVPTAGSASAMQLGDPGAVVLWRSSFSADGNKAVAESYSVPVDSTQWAKVSVLECTGAGCVPSEKATFAGGRAVTPASVGGSMALTSGGRVLTTSVAATGLLNSEYLRVWIRPEGSARVVKTASAVTQTLVPDEDGTIAWSTKVGTTTGVRRWDLRAAICTQGTPCRLASAQFVARYKHPK